MKIKQKSTQKGPNEGEKGQMREKRWKKWKKYKFLKIMQCPDFANVWGDVWHLSHPKKLDGSDGGFNFLRIAFSSHLGFK